MIEQDKGRALAEAARRGHLDSLGNMLRGLLNESVILTANTTLTEDDSGNTFYLNAAAGFDVTLPPPKLGLKFTFVVKTAPTSNGYDIKTSGGADIMKGVITEGDPTAAGVSPSDDNADNLNLAANISLAGDWVVVESDGTYWYARGSTRADAGAVFSTT